MTAGDILDHVGGLTHSQLTYFVRAGYVKPRKIKRGSLYYNDFSENDRRLIERAWGYIKRFDMRTRSAFERAESEIADRQMTLL